MSKIKPAPLPPDTTIGGYRVIRRLSSGGFGVVYLAVDAEGQQVAIKEYLPSSLATRAPGERNRLHGDELPGGRDAAGLHHHRARPQDAEGFPRIDHSFAV